MNTNPSNRYRTQLLPLPDQTRNRGFSAYIKCDLIQATHIEGITRKSIPHKTLTHRTSFTPHSPNIS